MPLQVMQSESYVGLSPYARSLLYEIGMQYDGGNNGRLTATWAKLRNRGFRSKDTINKALRELVGSGLIVLTDRPYRLSKKPNRYALTFRRIDWVGTRPEGVDDWPKVSSVTILNTWKEKKQLERVAGQ